VLEFFAGSLFTIFLIAITRRVFLQLDFKKKYLSIGKIVYRQSHVHDLVGAELGKLINLTQKNNTQSRNLMASQDLRVVFVDSLAYWIKDNCLYQASVIDGKIDDFSKKRVDTMGMNKVELDKMFFIVQKLTEGKKNDGRDPRHKGL
jgi:hypothetical protein